MISSVKFLVLLYLLVIEASLSESLNSYIYLPDKYIQEEISIGSFIADLAEELDKVDKLKPTSRSEQPPQDDSSEHQHYTFLEETSTENAYYLVDSITGRLTSKRFLDRESLCMNKHCLEPCDLIIHSNSTKLNNCKMNLKILLIPSYDIVSLNVLVQDLNDNKPQFRIDLINQSIPENVPIGYKIPIDSAYDPDSGINSIQAYTLSSSTGVDTFQLVHSQNELALVVENKLDREKVSQYNLSISACDGGAPSNCGQLRLILNIIDVNDHSPVFAKDSYTFKVNENIPGGTVIGQVSAYDLDEAANGQIKYKLIGFNGQTPRLSSNVTDTKVLSNYFDLNEDTGVLKLNQAVLDYESDQQYSLSVEARDCGVGSLPAYATIELIIQDINDNSPEISVSFFNTLHRNLTRNQSTQTIYLKENYEANKFLALVSLVDRDAGENAHIDFKLFVNNQEIKQNSNNQLLAMNILNANSFTINTGLKSNKLFDRERISNLNVSIMSWDYGDKSNIAYFTFMIVLLDENDNAPKFDKEEYELNIYENNEVDKFIYKLNATDLDLDENGRIVYMIEFVHDEEEKNFVYVEETTGILRAARVFDREIRETYTFYVIARDSSADLNKRLWSKVKCNLNILDQNDNKPKIVFNQTSVPFKEFSNKTHLILSIDENIPVNTHLVAFACNDSDANNNGKTKFLLQPDSVPFKIGDDGKLIVVKKLDREAVDSYEMQLVCHDQPHNRFEKLNASLSLLIRLNDVNDNCPRLVNASDETPLKTKFINRNHLNDSISELISLNYSDLDAGKNAQLKFQLQSHVNLFKLDIVERKSFYTVRVQLKTNNLTNFKLGKYLVKFRVSDTGYPTCVKTDAVTLYIGSTAEARTQEILIDLLKQSANKKKSDEYALNADFVNDQEEETYEEDPEEESNDETVLTKSVQSKTTNRSLLSLFKSKQFIILFILIATLVLIAIMLSIIGLAYCIKKPKRKKKASLAAAETLKVKNYREGDDLLNRNSNASSLQSTEEENVANDDEDQTEMNNLLEQTNAKTLNRYSMMSTDKSNSANSVISNITYLQRDTSSCSKQSNEYNLMRSHYANKRNSTFISNNSSNSSSSSSNNNNNNKPIYEQNLKTSSSFLSSSSSSSITPPYVPYSKQQSTETNEFSNNNKLEMRKFLSDNSTLPNYIKLNRNYHHHQQQQQQRMLEPTNQSTTNRTLLKSFPYNQLKKSTELQQQRLIKNLNDSTSSTSSASSSTSSSSSSSQMVTPSNSECGEIIIVPTTTTSTITSTSPSASSNTDSDYSGHHQHHHNSSTMSRTSTSRMHFLRSSAV